MVHFSINYLGTYLLYNFHYLIDPQVEAERRSLNTEGLYEGGGVCIACRHHTAGINCEHCKEGFYRPKDVSQFDQRPCVKCQCAGLVGSKGGCYNNADAEKLSRKGVNPGDCICKPGFTGSRCDKCEKGYHNFPYCEPCPCTLAGTMNEVRIHPLILFWTRLKGFCL